MNHYLGSSEEYVVGMRLENLNMIVCFNVLT